MNTTNPLIQNLQKPEIFNHPVSQFKLIETHISWVVLTGDFVYKIKKPFDFKFLDFSTLEKRKFYCEEEIRLNKLLAPEIYLDIVTINGDTEHPQINGKGPVIEYAIKMKQFPQNILLSDLLKQEKLNEAIIDDLAKLVADFHHKTPAAGADTRFGTPEHVHFPVVQNFDQIEPLLTDKKDLEQIARLRAWTEAQYKQHHALLEKRKQQGFIRDTHGDLHLGNIILYHNKPILFDRIEFNDDLRWNDVLADIAFLAMDLEDKKQPAFAHRLINTYFSHTQDYEGLALLPYYESYRATVRAKISLFRLMQPGLSEQEKNAVTQDYRNFINLAEKFTHPTKPALLITHGLAGSGKSTIARFLVEKLGAIQISSDVVRKKLFDLPIDARTDSGLYSGIYSPEATQKTYQQLGKLAETIIKAGYIAIVDATFPKHEQRTQSQNLADQLHVPFCILNCEAPIKELETNIKARQAKNTDASEADVAVLHALEKNVEPLNTNEKLHALAVNATIDVNEFIKALKSKITS